MNAIIPKSPISIRPAVASDLSFIDGLQKIHSKNVGWMQTKAIETKIERGEILVAEDVKREDVMGSESSHVFTSSRVQVGYCMGQDRYFKHDDIGIIYQMNIAPGHQRGLVGASLLKAQFERSAYGCKLYCCWCAQDIAANKFWEAMGFVPLAFRAGSEKKARVHIFWQRRIRAGDVSTPYWFPSQTTGGSIREDRLVLPIPPGVHWSEVRGTVLPVVSEVERPTESAELKVLSAEKKPSARKAQHSALGSQQSRPPSGSVVVAAGGGLWYKPKKAEKQKVACPERSRGEKVKACPERSRREPKKKRKNNPKMVAAARELRDRWLEQVNEEGLALPRGKYDVSRPALSAVEGMIVASVIDPPDFGELSRAAPMKQLAA